MWLPVDSDGLLFVIQCLQETLGKVYKGYTQKHSEWHSSKKKKVQVIHTENIEKENSIEKENPSRK